MYNIHKKQPLFLCITLKVMKFIKIPLQSVTMRDILYTVDEMNNSTDGTAVNVYKL